MLCFLLFFAPIWLYAQAGIRRAVAIIPFWGEDESIVEQFGDELLFGVSSMKDFAPWPIDMTRLPPDVPQGGFPPFVCPSPSLTRGAPYAITGELTLDREMEQWHLRLYLWQMSDNRLLFSDELTAYDKDDCAGSLPGMLEWIFSWIPSGEPVRTGSGHSRVVYFAATEPLKWLYAGVRGGGALHIHTSPISDGLAEAFLGSYYENFNIAAHANVQFLGALGLQLEAVYTMDFEPDGQTSSFLFPGLLRYSYRRGTMVVSAMGGGYLGVPLGRMKDEYFYHPLGNLIGWTAGINFGNKVGPGYVYLDIRWWTDVTDTAKREAPGGGEAGYLRNMLTLCIGYEAGFFRK